MVGSYFKNRNFKFADKAFTPWLSKSVPYQKHEKKETVQNTYELCACLIKTMNTHMYIQH